MKHVCFVTDEIYPGTPGGIGRLISATARELHASGRAVSLLLTVDQMRAGAFREYAAREMPGVSVYTLEELLNDLVPDERIPLWAFHFESYHRSYRVALALRRLIAITDIDGVEFNDYQGLGYVTLKWRRLWGDPFAHIDMWVRLHGSLKMCLSVDDARRYTPEETQVFAMETYSLRHADAWISPSKDVANWYAQMYEIPAKRVIVGTPEFEHHGTGHTHHRTSHEVFKVLFYGKLQHLKGPDLLIDAALSLIRQSKRNVEFVFAGPDVEHPWLGSTQAELERRIPPSIRSRFSFLGRIDPSELQGLAETCDVAVVPSRAETFCLAAHELNWIGIPLVLNRIPAFQAYFEDGKDCLFFDGSAAKLASALMSLIDGSVDSNHWRWNAASVVSQQRTSAAYADLDAGHKHGLEPTGASHDEMPLVSVIVPYFEMHDYIDNTLTSILSSDHSRLQIIVVDDGSRSVYARQKFDALAQHFSKDERFMFIRKDNGGLGSARNLGIRSAKGEYILPLDSDDVIEPDYITAAVQALTNCPDLEAVSSYVSYFQDGTAPQDAVDYVIPYDLHPVLIAVENRAGVACSVFRRRLFDRFFYDERLTAYEDWDLWWSIAENDLTAEVMPRILYRYRRRTSSMFHSTGMSRHRHLLQTISEKHDRLFVKYGGQVFRHLQAAENDAGPTSAVSRQSRIASARDLYREARDLRDTTTYRLGRWLRNLKVDLQNRLSARTDPHEVPHRVAIRALESGRREAKGREVWFVGLRTDESGVFQLRALRSSGAWVRRAISHPILDQCLLAAGGEAALEGHARGEALHFAFLHHPWSGQVAITIDGKTTTFDLFASEGDTAFKEYRWAAGSWSGPSMIQ